MASRTSKLGRLAMNVQGANDCTSALVRVVMGLPKGYGHTLEGAWDVNNFLNLAISGR